MKVALLMAPITDLINGRLVPSQQDSYHESPQLGPITLATILALDGVDVQLVDWVSGHEFGFREQVERLAAFDIVLFSANSMNWSTVRLFIRHIKKRSSHPICVVGGPHPTLYPDAVLEEEGVDAVYVGEADDAIVPIIRAIEQHGRVPYGLFGSLLVRGETEPVQNQIHVSHSRFDNFLPDYNLVNLGRYQSVPVETSRGCKFRCTFCSIPSKSHWRGFSELGAVSRIHHGLVAAARTRANIASIIDDTFTTDHERAISICSSIDRDLSKARLTFDATIADLRNPNLVNAIAPHCAAFLVGVEVASKRDAKRIRKAATPLLVAQAADNLLAARVSERAVFSIIIGFPWQSLEDCQETLAYALQLINTYGVTVYLQWYWPIPGSEIWAELTALGQVDLRLADYPGYFRDLSVFASIRSMATVEIERADDAILQAQVHLDTSGSAGRLVYAPLKKVTSVSLPRRNAFIERAE